MVGHFGFPWLEKLCVLGKAMTYNMVKLKLKLQLKRSGGTLRQLQVR